MDIQIFLPIIAIVLPIVIILYMLFKVLWVQNILSRPLTNRLTLKGELIKILSFCLLEFLIYELCFYSKLFFTFNENINKLELLSLVFTVIAVFVIIISVHQSTRTKLTNKVTFYDITYDHRPKNILILEDITESGFFKLNLIFSVIGIFVYDKVNFKGYKFSEVKLDFIDEKLVFNIWQVSFYVLVIVTLMTVIWGYSSVRESDKSSYEDSSNSDFQFNILFDKRIKSNLKEILFNNSDYGLYERTSISVEKINDNHQKQYFIFDTILTTCDKLVEIFPTENKYLKRAIFNANYRKLTKQENTYELYRIFKDMYRLLEEVPDEQKYNKEIFGCYNVILLTLESFSKNKKLFKNSIADNEIIYIKRKFTDYELVSFKKLKSIILPDDIFCRNTSDVNYWIKINSEVTRISKIFKSCIALDSQNNNKDSFQSVCDDKFVKIFHKIFDNQLRAVTYSVEYYKDFIESIAETQIGIDYLKSTLKENRLNLNNEKLIVLKEILNDLI